MKFTYSVIGDNTPENREHLVEIGYMPSYFFDDENDPCIKTQKNGKFLIIGATQFISTVVDCANNPELFKAVTAIRDDSNIHQWFIDPLGHWNYNPVIMDGMRKASLAELQEHFKMNKQENKHLKM